MPVELHCLHIDVRELCQHLRHPRVCNVLPQADAGMDDLVRCIRVEERSSAKTRSFTGATNFRTQTSVLLRCDTSLADIAPSSSHTKEAVR